MGWVSQKGFVPELKALKAERRGRSRQQASAYCRILRRRAKRDERAAVAQQIRGELDAMFPEPEPKPPVLAPLEAACAEPDQALDSGTWATQGNVELFYADGGWDVIMLG